MQFKREQTVLIHGCGDFSFPQRRAEQYNRPNARERGGIKSMNECPSKNTSHFVMQLLLHKEEAVWSSARVSKWALLLIHESLESSCMLYRRNIEANRCILSCVRRYTYLTPTFVAETIDTPVPHTSSSFHTPGAQTLTPSLSNAPISSCMCCHPHALLTSRATSPLPPLTRTPLSILPSTSIF